MKSIAVDSGFVAAVHRQATGATVHQLMNLLQSYVSYAALGMAVQMESAKRKAQRILIEQSRRDNEIL